MGFLLVMGRTALELSHLIAYKPLSPRGISKAGCPCISPVALSAAPARVLLSPLLFVLQGYIGSLGLYRYCIGIVSVLYRYCIGIVSVLYRYCIGIVSVLYRVLYLYCIGIVSVLYRYCIGIVSVLYRYCICIVSEVTSALYRMYPI